MEQSPSSLAHSSSLPQPSPAIAGSGRWPQRIGRAWHFAFGDFDAAVVALGGFLVRGGIVVLAVPSVVLPSFLGLASVFSVNALGIDGRPTPWLVWTVALACVAGAVWLAIASVAGSIVDLWLIRAVLVSDPRTVSRPQGLPDPGLLLDMVSVRICCLLPVGAAIVAAASPIYDAVYDELTLPTNLSDPLILRVVERAAMPLALIAAVWLVTEAVAAVAVRRLTLGDGVLASLAGAIRQLVLRPLTSLLTLAATTVVSVAAVAAVAVATGAAFGLVLDAARLPDTLALVFSTTTSPDSAPPRLDLRPIVFVGSVLVLCIAWMLALAVVGIASTWRSAAWTEETTAARGRSARQGNDPTRQAGTALLVARDASPNGIEHRHTADL